MVKKNLLYHLKFWAGLLFAQFLLFYFLPKSSFVISKFKIIFEAKQAIQEKIFSKINSSFGDFFYLFIALILIYIFFKILIKNSRKEYLLLFLIILNISYLIYQISWGMLYFQKPIVEKLSKKEITKKEIEKLALYYIYLTNKTRENVSEDKNGIFKIKNLKNLKTNILKSHSSIPKEFQAFSATETTNFKPSLWGNLMNYSGILGYYNPFTGEAQYNENLPNTYIPFTLAHENSHQLGFAREEEANFIGFLICENSKIPELQYSAYLYTYKSLLKQIAQYNPEFAIHALQFFSKKVNLDLRNDKLFTQKYSGFFESFFHITNDIFLKTNQQDGSITYSYFIDLLVKYKRKESHLTM